MYQTSTCADVSVGIASNIHVNAGLYQHMYVFQVQQLATVITCTSWDTMM